MSARFPGRQIQGGGAAAADEPRTGRGVQLVQLVTRFVIAQAAVAAAIGLSYSRRHLPSIFITLMLVAALLGLAALTRSGARAAWVTAIGFEAAFIMFGLIRFAATRYLGGTLLGMITLGVLLHPAVARAFSGPRDQAEHGFATGPSLAEAAAEALGDGVPG